MHRLLLLLAVLAAVAFLTLGPGVSVTAQEETHAAEAAHGAAADHGGEHENHVVPVLLALVVVLMAAKIGGAALERFGQPAVLGELIVGELPSGRMVALS